MYSLGVDLGTTFVAAAITHESQIEIFTLGDRTMVSPAVVYLREDGAVVTGDAATRRAVSGPDRVGREFKRRLGDPTPVMLGGEPHAVTALLGALLRDVMHKVVATEGSHPDRVVLTHPANWGPFRRELFEDVPEAAGLTNWQMVTEPEAAAAHYAASRQLDNGETVAVYDLGGGTFDATILCKHSEGVEILGTPEGIERLGGIDFDEAVMSYVNFSSGGALSELDMGDPATAVALARLRQDCVLAKEALSVDTEATIPVFLPNRHFEVRVTRPEFEDLIRAMIESTVAALSRTLRSARVEPEQLSAVLLVGGSSRIPLVGRMLTEHLGRPTVVDTHPKHAVALGAATLAEIAAHPEQNGHPLAQNTRAANHAVAVRDPDSAPVQHPVPVAATAAQPSPGTSAPTPPAPRENQTGPGVAVLPPPPDPGPGTSRTTGGRPGGGPPPGAGPPPPATGPPAPPDGPAPPSFEPEPGRHHRVPIALGAVVLVLALALALAFVLWPRGTGTPGAPSEPAYPTVPAKAPGPPPPDSLASPTVGAVFSVGAGPQSGAITPDGRFAYVASTHTNSISVVDLATNQVTAVIPIAAGPPVFVAFTPDGSRAYVSVFDEIHQTGNAVVVVDTATRVVTGMIPAEKYPYAVAMSPNGRQLYVPNHDADLISVVDTKTNTVSKKITVKPNPHCVAFSVDGRRAYVANHQSNVVTVLDSTNGVVLTEIPVGTSPHAVAMSPDAKRVYVVNYNSDTVSVIDPASNTVTATIAVQREPQSVAFAPDGRHAYIVNDGSNTVSVIDTATNQITATVGVGQTPTHVFVAPDGRRAYVTNISSNDVTVLNIAG